MVDDLDGKLNWQDLSKEISDSNRHLDALKDNVDTIHNEYEELANKLVKYFRKGKTELPTSKKKII